MERSQDDNTAQKGDMRDIKNYRPISLLSHMYKMFTRIIQKRMERFLDENQPREQVGFKKGYSTVDHLEPRPLWLISKGQFSFALGPMPA